MLNLGVWIFKPRVKMNAIKGYAVVNLGFLLAQSRVLINIP